MSHMNHRRGDEDTSRRSRCDGRRGCACHNSEGKEEMYRRRAKKRGVTRADRRKVAQAVSSDRTPPLPASNFTLPNYHNSSRRQTPPPKAGRVVRARR